MISAKPPSAPLPTCLAGHLGRFGARVPLPADADFLAALYASTRPDLLGKGGADPELVASLMGMQRRLQGADYARRFPGAITLLLHLGVEPAARIVVYQTAQSVRLVDLAVAPALRGRGMGTGILRSLQHWAQLHALPLQLAVSHGNAGAQRLYRSLGFVVERADTQSAQLVWLPA